MSRHRTDEGTNRRPQGPPPSGDPNPDSTEATGPGDSTQDPNPPPEPKKPVKRPDSHHTPLAQP